MDTDRRKNASLAINAILRGLEFDQLTFRYDATARPDIGYRRVELRPLERTTTAA